MYIYIHQTLHLYDYFYQMQFADLNTDMCEYFTKIKLLIRYDIVYKNWKKNLEVSDIFMLWHYILAYRMA